MIGKKTLESKPIPAAEVKEILEEFSLKHELTAEQNFTLEHVRSLNKISLEDTEKLIEELTGFFQEKEEEELAFKHAVRIADLLPQDLDDLRLIFAKERISLSSDDLIFFLFLFSTFILLKIIAIFIDNTTIFKFLPYCNFYF